MGITYEGCTGTTTNTTAFSNARANIWEVVTDITVGDGSIPPAIIFTYESGFMAGTGGRWYSDAFRFQDDPCVFSTVSELSTVNGPLVTGQTYVDVPDIASGAQGVNVYADGVQIGQKSSGVTAGVNRVTTSPLAQGQMITATQTDPNGVETCRPILGQFVGGGPNPAFGMAISIRQTNLMESAIGVNGGAPGSILKFIGATGTAGSQLAPLGNRIFYPSNEWQTVQFQRGDDPANPIDPTFLWNGTDATDPHQLKYNFGVFDSIAFTAENDTGPFAIYIDEFRNGDTLIQGFESAVLGQSGSTFTLPSISGTTDDFLLAQSPGIFNPNVSIVTNNASDGGAHSLYASWQFNTTNRSAWLRLAAVATTSGSSPNPIVDLRLPISFRMLILPVGQQPPPLPAEAFAGPADHRAMVGDNVTMRFTYRGTAPFTFQWRRNGSNIPDATNATLTLTNVQVSQAGNYTVLVSNSLGSDESPAGTLTVDVPYPNIMTLAWQLPTGSRPYLTNDNATRSIAWSPRTGNLLVASRSGGSNNVYVLDGLTGDFLHILQPPAGGFTGGILALNQVVVGDGGTVYAGNVTTDGATDNFKLYRWFGDDSPNEPCEVIWQGNPATDANIHLRWGDTMTVRGPLGGHEVVLSSRTGTMLSIILPDFPSVVALDVANAPSGGFGLGLGAALDMVWGKAPGLPLLQVQTDPNLTSATLINSFSGFNTMSAVGVNSGNTLLAGVFVDNPDHLRLFDISTSGSIVALDTEFFPSDNANVNATGSVAFGDGKVYALDSNNGLIAMNLDTSCLPDRATIERDGADVIISWTRSTYHLQGTGALGSLWDPIPGTSPVRITGVSGIHFFRLVCTSP